MPELIKVRIVESISEGIEQIQSRIRERAYGKFLARANESNRELEDWFAAERELICVLTPAVSEEEGQFVARVEIPEINADDLRIPKGVTTERASGCEVPRGGCHDFIEARSFAINHDDLRLAACDLCQMS